MKHGSHGDNRRLYPKLIAEFRRVLKPGGTMVLLSAETRLMSELWTKAHLRPSRILRCDGAWCARCDLRLLQLEHSRYLSSLLTLRYS